MDAVPVVDIRDPTAASMAAVDASCRNHGFFLIEGHGLNRLIEETWRQTCRFFGAGPTVTEPIRRDADNHLGYFDRELTKRVRDHKELFDFIDPRPGTIVVNLGDMMQVWTNDQYRAAVHRVVPMTTSDRYSIPLFFNPAADTVISPIDQLCDPVPYYKAFTWREFIEGRMDDNFAYCGADDVQITDFRIQVT